MKKLFKTLALIIIITTILSLSIGYNLHKQKKAIILLPGFLGSMLIDENNIYWITYKIPGYEKYQEPRSSEKSGIKRLFEALTLDEYQNRSVEMYPPSVSDTDLIGGTFNTYLQLYNYLNDRFSQDFDVINFQYDWMKSDVFNAKELDGFLEKNKYGEVVILSHSMGGLVADNYLALGEKQRQRVSLYASFGSPHGGVVEALSVLESRSYGGLPSIFSSIFGNSIFDIARNMTSVLQMMPNEILLNSPYYKDEISTHKSFIRIETSPNNYEYLTDWEDIKEFYCQREWAQYIDDGERRGQVKDTFTETLDMFDALYYQNELGDYEHISNKVNSYYFVGNRTSSNSSVCVQYNLNGTVTILRERGNNDGTVSFYSASCGYSENNKRVKIYNTGHGDIILKINEENVSPIVYACNMIENL